MFAELGLGMGRAVSFGRTMSAAKEFCVAELDFFVFVQGSWSLYSERVEGVLRSDFSRALEALF